MIRIPFYSYQVDFSHKSNALVVSGVSNIRKRSNLYFFVFLNETGRKDNYFL